jgi:nucleoside phosphorylase
VIDVVFVPRGAEESAARRALRGKPNAPVVRTTGIGPSAAARSVEEALRDGAPATALVTGLCGLLSPSLVVGDLLLYATVTRADGATVACDGELSAALARRLPGAQTGIRGYTCETIVCRASEKRALAARADVEAVDMESFALADGLRRAGARVAVLRVGSDGVDEELPDIRRGIDAQGNLKGAALALALLRRPVAGARLAVHGVRALCALERALARIARPA